MSYYARRALLLMTPSQSSQRKKRTHSISTLSYAATEPRQQQKGKEDDTNGNVRDMNKRINPNVPKDSDHSQSFSQKSSQRYSHSQRFLSWDDNQSYSRFHNSDNNIIPSQPTVHTVTTHSSHHHGTTNTNTSTTGCTMGYLHKGKNNKRSWIAAALSVMQSPNKKSKGKDSTLPNARLGTTTMSNANDDAHPIITEDTTMKSMHKLEDKWRQEFEALSATVQTTIESIEQLHTRNDLLLQQPQISEQMIQDRIQSALQKQEERLTQAFNREIQTVSLRLQNKFMLELENNKQMLMQSQVRVQKLQTKYDLMSQQNISAPDISQMIYTQIHHHFRDMNSIGVGVIDSKVKDAVSSMIPNLESRIYKGLQCGRLDEIHHEEYLNSHSRGLTLQHRHKVSQNGAKNQVTPTTKTIQNHAENLVVGSMSLEPPNQKNGKFDTEKTNHNDNLSIASSSISSSDSASNFKENEKVIIVDKLPGEMKTDEKHGTKQVTLKANQKCKTDNVTPFLSNQINEKSNFNVSATVTNKASTKSFAGDSFDCNSHAPIIQGASKKNAANTLSSRKLQSRGNSVPKRRSSRLAKPSQNLATSDAIVSSDSKSVSVVPVTLSTKTAPKRAGHKSIMMDNYEDRYQKPVTLERKQISVPKTKRFSRKRNRSTRLLTGFNVSTCARSHAKMDVDSNYKLKNSHHNRGSSTVNIHDQNGDESKLTHESLSLPHNPHGTIENVEFQKKKGRIGTVSTKVGGRKLFSSEEPSNFLLEFDENRLTTRKKLPNLRFTEIKEDSGVFDFEE